MDSRWHDILCRIVAKLFSHKLWLAAASLFIIYNLMQSQVIDAVAGTNLILIILGGFGIMNQAQKERKKQ